MASSAGVSRVIGTQANPVKITGALPSGGGIQFDTDNEGGWLFIATNDTTEAGGPIDGHSGLALSDSSGGGMEFSTTGGGPISFFPHGDFHVQVAGGGLLNLESFDGITISATDETGIWGSNKILLGNSPTGGYQLQIDSFGLKVIHVPTASVLLEVDLASGVKTPGGTVGTI